MPSPKANTQDVDAYSDSGSTISLASCGSGGSGFAPKPPLDGSFRSKSVKGRRSRVVQTSQSPYASRQQTSKKNEAINSSTRSLWLTSMKNGTGALSTNNTSMNTWAGPRPSHAKKRRPGSRTRNFSDVVELSNNKTKTHSRSATLSYSEPQLVGGRPALKPAEDYYDEIIELKKIINSLKEDNNLMSTKLHRVEEENMLKDRKMDDLLNSRKQPEDFRRTLTDKRGDTSSIVNSLKQKLHGVERTVKEKEAELSNLRRDLKMTDIEELKIQSEIYYQEVQRLQLAMLQMQQERINYTGSRTDLYTTDDTRSARGKRPTSASQQRLQKDIEMLKAENKSLKKDLILAVENQSKRNKKPLNFDYADMSRSQLLHTIHELEMRIDETRDRADYVRDEQDEKDIKKRKSKESEDTKQRRSEDNEAEILEEREKLRHTIERLKDDRTHYRNVADDLRKQLKAKDEEIEDLRHRLSEIRTATTSTSTSTSAPRRKSSTESTASQSSARKQTVTAKKRDEQMEKQFEEFKQRHAAKVLQKQWRTYQGKKDEISKEQDKLKQEQAAKTLQREWKKHLQQKEAGLQNEAITDIQAAFRGHLARKDRLDRLQSDSLESDDAIINVQSAMRGHLTRSKNREEPEDEWSRDRSRGSNERFSHELSDSEGSGDDIVISRSSGSTGHRRMSPERYDKSPFSAKKRSSFTAASASPSPSPPQPIPRTRSPKQPHPAPRTLIALDSTTLPPLPSTPPSPAPRHKGRTPEIELPESDGGDSDDDNVVIGISSLARKAQPKTIPSIQNNNKQIDNNKNRSDPKPTTTSGAKEPTIHTSSYMDHDQSEQVLNETDSDSDNDLLVCGKTAQTSWKIKQSNDNKKGKPHLQEISNYQKTKPNKTKQGSEWKEKPENKMTIVRNDELNNVNENKTNKKITNMSEVLTNEKPAIVSTNEIEPTSLPNDISSISSANENASTTLTDEKSLITSTNKIMSNMSTDIKSSSELANKNTASIVSANENSFIGLTNGSQSSLPVLTTNRFFSGIEWNKTNTMQKQRTPEERNPEKQNIKDTENQSNKPTKSNESLNHIRKNVLLNDSISCDLTKSCDLTSDKTILEKGQPQSALKDKIKRLTENQKEIDKITSGLASGLTKHVNPQRTITEASEESDNQIMSDRSKNKSNYFQKTPSSKNPKQSRHEIIDSDDDDDDDEIDTITKGETSKNSKTFVKSKTLTEKSGSSDVSSTRNHEQAKMRKTSSREHDDSDDESDDDDIVFTSKNSKAKHKSTLSTASTPKRDSLVDSLLSPKRSLRSSEDIRTRGRSLIQDDDDDDDDDDDIVIGSWRKRSTKGEKTSNKDSLSSLWSDSSKQKKKSSSDFGFGSFGNTLSSSSRRIDSNLDELF